MEDQDNQSALWLGRVPGRFDVADDSKVVDEAILTALA
jgi:hypothetical protein